MAQSENAPPRTQRRYFRFNYDEIAACSGNNFHQKLRRHAERVVKDCIAGGVPASHLWLDAQTSGGTNDPADPQVMYLRAVKEALLPIWSPRILSGIVSPKSPSKSTMTAEDIMSSPAMARAIMRRQPAAAGMRTSDLRGRPPSSPTLPATPPATGRMVSKPAADLPSPSKLRAAADPFRPAVPKPLTSAAVGGAKSSEVVPELIDPRVAEFRRRLARRYVTAQKEQD
ncbi:uncharacterized protein JN550_013077 [Neoarthrinium moseri]|uniref:uncharacterized protein n=1 Tax=Neoarthrinium moseri TaxID=1658444 RepID=UPI001FDAFFFA|nr:uncharacterized protein JN550_013077 [Neoarthrinium moseri]KAI1857741.1 hypothetical protein JN550_013077 [Neoarthrinium moseri]